MTEIHIQETPEEARRLWADALRSGEFVEGRVFLASRNGSGEMQHCCLGVACELFRARYPQLLHTRVIPLSATGYAAVEFREADGNGQRFALPDTVRKWLGLSDVHARLRYTVGEDAEITSLAEASDASFTFIDMARLIDSDSLETEPTTSLSQ
jgi:hypothetical protein